MTEPISMNSESHGESFSSELTFTWINPRPIAAGEQMAPVALSFPEAQSFAALHLILQDLAFASDCLKLSNTYGIPDDRSLQSKALIFSGIVGYARCFKSGVRNSLNASDLVAKGTPFDLEIHEYMLALRDKHIAHSVNDYEECQTVAILVGRPETGWRDGSGIGVTMKRTVGISSDLLLQAVAHIEKLKQFITVDLESKRLSIYDKFREDFGANGQWEMAPLVRMSDRSRISKRRK